jgi:ubiquinone/menaquinone biosynthesis C-methylase UbiE
LDTDLSESLRPRAPQRQRRIRVAIFVSFGIFLAVILSFLDQGIQTFSRLEHVERARDRWQRPDEIIQELRPKEGSVVVDVGSGVGYFAMKLSQKVGASGKVVAVDIQKFPLLVLRTRAVIAGRHNIAVVFGEPDDPHLPSSSADAVLIANTYHELHHPEVILGKLRQALRPGGLLVIVDHAGQSQAEVSREDEAERHEIAPGLVEADLRKQGFQTIRREDHFAVQLEEGQVWWIIVACKVI